LLNFIRFHIILNDFNPKNFLIFIMILYKILLILLISFKIHKFIQEVILFLLFQNNAFHNEHLIFYKLFDNSLKLILFFLIKSKPLLNYIICQHLKNGFLHNENHKSIIPCLIILKTIQIFHFENK
jgi:hypothetical protein